MINLSLHSRTHYAPIHVDRIATLFYLWQEMATYGPWVQLILFTIMCTLINVFPESNFWYLNYELSIILRLAILETNS
jgi:hypothetical protein